MKSQASAGKKKPTIPKGPSGDFYEWRYRVVEVLSPIIGRMYEIRNVLHKNNVPIQISDRIMPYVGETVEDLAYNVETVHAALGRGVIKLKTNPPRRGT